MRLAVLADVHGNLPALEAVLADVRRIGAEGLIVAGDVTGGTHSQEAIDQLRALGAWMIQGNSEGYVLALARGQAPEAWYTNEQWAFMRWSYQHLNGETLDWIASLPEQGVVALDGMDPIRVVHGSPSGTRQHLFPDADPACLAVFRQAGILAPDREPPPLDEALAGVEEPVVLCGHSHIAWQQEGASRLVVNPGSVGAPINGDPRAQYALLGWEGGRWRARLKAVVYDLGRVRAAFRDSGLLAEGGAFARACLLGAETGLNVPGMFLNHVYRLAEEAGWMGGDLLPDEVWTQAVETFGWEMGVSHEA